jgi:putative hydrolase of the HAD superfamily
MYKAVTFDLGDTLITYQNVPLNWQSFYRKALRNVCNVCGVNPDDHTLTKAEKILTQYNTRIHPRIKEVSSDEIMTSILQAWNINPTDYLNESTEAFFSFFQKDFTIYEDTIYILSTLEKRNRKIAICTDVPYGMPSQYVQKDIEPFKQYIDVLITSREVGYRKPDVHVIKTVLSALNCQPDELMIVGNEKKDIQLAKNRSVFSVQVDRSGVAEDYGADRVVKSLRELEDLI